MSEPVVVLDDVVKQFERADGLFDAIRGRHRSPVRAVDGVSLEVRPGEVVAIVGESGCGKTTTANLILGLISPDRGRVVVAGDDLSGLSTRELRRKKRRLQIVFQDPYESLNPRMTVGEIVAEPLRVHHAAAGPADLAARVRRAMEFAGLRPVEVFLRRTARELSGGQRQRVVIASALALEPTVLVADEPVSMLDVSIRAEILNLLGRLARDEGISVVMITHDLSTVAAYAHRIAVMYLGRIVEIGDTTEVLTRPIHPYTEALLSVVPVPRPDRDRARIILSGEAPDPSRIPSGCRFHPRCPVAVADCAVIDPMLEPVGPIHAAACILAGQRSADR